MNSNQSPKLHSSSNLLSLQHTNSFTSKASQLNNSCLNNSQSGIITNPLLSQSLNFHPQQIYTATLNLQTERQKQDDEISQMKKQIRAKESEFIKERAVLLQKVELLNIQLEESNERELNLKKINENILTALQNLENEREKSFEIEINEEHPKVAEIIKQVKYDHQIYIQQERDRSRESEYQIQKEMQNLSFKLLESQKKNELMSTQLDFINQEHTKLEQKYVKECTELELKLKQETDDLKRRHKMEIETLNTDIDRLVTIKLNEKLKSDSGLNQQIINLQREVQVNLDEIKEYKSKINYLERELEQLEDKNRKIEDENSSLKIKMKQSEKKQKEEIEGLNKRVEEQEKIIEQYEKNQLNTKRQNIAVNNNTNNSLQRKAVNNFGQKSRNKVNTLLNKENAVGNKSQPLDLTEDDDEEKNKLRRQISYLRCQLKKLEIELKDQKSKYTTEIAQLKDKLNVERKKRMNIYEDKIDKNNQMLQDLLEKDQTIFTLNREINKLQEKLQNFTGNIRGATPNHLLSSSLHESAIHTNNILTHSMIDFAPNQQNAVNQSKRLISPLRSLDLNLFNKENIQNMNGLSFSMLPLQSNRAQKTQRMQSQKKQTTTSPKQIKRARINSVQVSTRQSNHNLVTQSLHKIVNLKNSKEGSIAEVNEDLYKESIESQINQNTLKKIQAQNLNEISTLEPKQIILQSGHDKPKIGSRFFTQRMSNDSELAHILLAENQKNPMSNNFVYQDSLENLSQSSENENQDLYQQYQQNANIQPQTQKSSHSNQNYFQFCKIRTSQERQKAKEIHQENLRKHRSKILEDAVFNEDDDCLVNILDQEDTNIEVQPTINHTRQQHLSTENLFRESQNTIETLNSFRNQHVQKQIRDLAKQKQASIPLPRPQKASFQKGAVQKTIQLGDINLLGRQESVQSNQKSRIVESATPTYLQRSPQIGVPISTIMTNDNVLQKSPSSPNIMNSSLRKSSSNHAIRPYNRNDSCPSPLDESETVMTLGSGEKLRIKEVNFQSLETYQNQFKEQRHKFSATLKPTTTKNSNRNFNPLQNENVYGFQTTTNKNSIISNITTSYGSQNNSSAQIQLRTRTNSLMNSCSEISLKMKFVNDKPKAENNQPNIPHSTHSSKMIHNTYRQQQQPQQSNQVNKKVHHHSRVPSMQLPSSQYSQNLRVPSKK